MPPRSRPMERVQGQRGEGLCSVIKGGSLSNLAVAPMGTSPVSIGPYLAPFRGAGHLKVDRPRATPWAVDLAPVPGAVAVEVLAARALRAPREIGRRVWSQDRRSRYGGRVDALTHAPAIRAHAPRRAVERRSLVQLARFAAARRGTGLARRLQPSEFRHKVSVRRRQTRKRRHKVSARRSKPSEFRHKVSERRLETRKRRPSAAELRHKMSDRGCKPSERRPRDACAHAHHRRAAPKRWNADVGHRRADLRYRNVHPGVGVRTRSIGTPMPDIGLRNLSIRFSTPMIGAPMSGIGSPTREIGSALYGNGAAVVASRRRGRGHGRVPVFAAISESVLAPLPGCWVIDGLRSTSSRTTRAPRRRQCPPARHGCAAGRRHRGHRRCHTRGCAAAIPRAGAVGSSIRTADRQ